VLADCLDSSSTEVTVARDEWKAEVQSSCCDDTVGHVGHNVSRNVREGVSYARIHRGNEKS
jgi:hypothetical protein